MVTTQDQRLSFSSGLHQQKVVSMNEEKQPLYFVWERMTVGIGLRYQAARYRELPKTGMGVDADSERFKVCVKLEGDEADINYPMISLINKYPCPVPQDKLPPVVSTDLTKNQMSRSAKKDHLGSLKVNGDDAEKILDKLYPD
jgi:hypothetical protein